MNSEYEKGTVKVVWITNSDFIYSRMFDDENEAKEFAKSKKDSLVFRLIKQKNMQDFVWELLPYGRHKLYKLLFNYYKKGLISKLIK